MATYTITIYVEDISNVILLFNRIRIYRSITGNESSRILYDAFDLTAGTATYTWADLVGQSSYVAWFTYYNSYTYVESGFSDPIQYGSGASEFVPGFSFTYRTYPEEYSLSYDEKVSVDTIRAYIGDSKKVKRDYLSTAATCLNDNISSDGRTLKLTEPPGWPLKVLLNGSECTSLLEPIINGYEYLTFSGSIVPSGVGSVDVWYENFRHSDREIFWSYQTAFHPSYITTATFTEDMRVVSASISILEMELRQIMGETSGSFTLTDELSYNPEPLLRQKREDIAGLRNKLNELINETVSVSIKGVRID